VHHCLGFRTVSIDNEEKHALSVLSAILGGGMSSRLFSEVREKRGLAYLRQNRFGTLSRCWKFGFHRRFGAEKVEEGMEVTCQRIC